MTVPSSFLIFPYSDKVVHCLIYIILAFIATNTFSLKKQTRAKAYPVRNGISNRAYGFLYAFLLGLSIEIMQLFLPFREFELTDLGANFLGSLLGCFLKAI